MLYIFKVFVGLKEEKIFRYNFECLDVKNKINILKKIFLIVEDVDCVVNFIYFSEMDWIFEFFRVLCICFRLGFFLRNVNYIGYVVWVIFKSKVYGKVIWIVFYFKDDITKLY